MTRTVLCIVHQATSDTGRVGRVLREMGYAVENCCPRGGQPLPHDLDHLAGAVVFGGPMSVNDHVVDPGIRAELDWLPRYLETGRPFLGICLGAQMLSKVLGGRVDYHPDSLQEIGFTRIRPTPAWTGVMDRPMQFYQWHKEYFDLPRGGVLLAEGDRYPNQAFRWGESAYGLQFHPEVTREIMQRWSCKSGDRLCRPEVQTAEEQLAANERHETEIEVWTHRFLAGWIGAARAEEQAEAAD